jgi:hypothetical protein
VIHPGVATLQQFPAKAGPAGEFAVPALQKNTLAKGRDLKFDERPSRADAAPAGKQPTSKGRQSS